MLIPLFRFAAGIALLRAICHRAILNFYNIFVYKPKLKSFEGIRKNTLQEITIFRVFNLEHSRGRFFPLIILYVTFLSDLTQFVVYTFIM